jgi:periplasmic protein TonB
MSTMRTMAAVLVGCGLLTLTAAARQAPATPGPMRVYSEATPGIVLPTVVNREQPSYTRAALDAQVAGDAAVDLTVGADGRVRDVLLVKSVDPVHGLDDAAVASAGRWTFTPATLNGQPVPVRVRVSMSFKTR